jgi:hypothetical protein
MTESTTYCLRFPTLSRTESKRTRVETRKSKYSPYSSRSERMSFSSPFQETVHYDPVEWIWHSNFNSYWQAKHRRQQYSGVKAAYRKRNSRDGDTVVRNRQTDSRTKRLGEFAKRMQKLWGGLTPVIRQSSWTWLV